MSKPTKGDWVIPVANIFRVLAVDENGKPTRLIHDQPDMTSYFGDVKLEWREEDGPEAAANTRLIAASKKLLHALEAFVDYYTQAGIGDCTEADEEEADNGDRDDGFDGDEIFNVRQGRAAIRMAKGS